MNILSVKQILIVDHSDLLLVIIIMQDVKTLIVMVYVMSLKYVKNIRLMRLGELNL